MAVFVLDRHHRPLMPCSEKRARLLLARHRAVIHRLIPFTIRLRDRRVEDSSLQPIALKVDPGSKTTGIALIRIEPTPDGEIHHALHLVHLEHRGGAVHQALLQRADYRRRRRTLEISAKGRGSHQRTNVNDCGFPVSYLMRQKRVRGFQTGDLVRADVPPPRKTAGRHLGRVAVRQSGSFRVGRVDGINATYCQVCQRADGYDYHLADLARPLVPEPIAALPPGIETSGHPR